MHKEIFNGSMPEKRPKEEVFSDEERLEQFIGDHPDMFTPLENLRECEPEIAEFEKMLEAFEAEHSLTDLNAIIDLTPAEAPMNPVREPARLALAPIVAKMKVLKKETNITPEKYDELEARYKIISRAVGMINNNKVDHNR